MPAIRPTFGEKLARMARMLGEPSGILSILVSTRLLERIVADAAYRVHQFEKIEQFV